MRHIHSLLCSTAALAAITLVASPAIAAAQDQPAPVNPTATAQQSPADPAQNADAPQSPEAAAGTGDNAIVVTGLRRALQSARNIKRNSDQVVDAIVADDIGKLPDITVSDTAARIPGVMVERSRGEASRVLVRGFDNTFYPTTYNSREIFTAETRSVALQDFPSGAIAAIEAFKTSTANLIEPGIAGPVNVRSRRPFDFKGLEVAGSVWGLYPLESRDLTPNGNILISDRWRVGDGEMGALINFSYTRLHYRDSIRRHAFWIAGNLGGAEGGRSPDFPELQINEGERTRPSVNAALQWRPSPDLELYAEGLWQGYRDDWSDRWMHFPLWGGASYDNLVVNDQGQVISGTVNDPAGCCGVVPEGWQGATKRRTNTYQFAVGGSYDAGPLRVSADLAHTASTFKLYTESVDFQLNRRPTSIDWYTGRPGGYGPTFTINGIDFSDPSIYNYRGFYEARQVPHGDDWQARLDFEYSPGGIPAISKLQWGVRYVDRNASNTFGDRYAYAGDLGIPISAVPLDYVLYPAGFRFDNHRPTPTQWIGPSFDSVWANMIALRQFDVNLGRAPDTNDPPPNPAAEFNIHEKSYAGYAQASFKFDLGGDASVDGIVGLRGVRTEEDIHGFSVTGNPQVATPVDYRNRYWDWLPNANLNVHFARNWQLRLAVTRTRTRPTFQQLNPALVLAPPIIGCDPTVTHCARTGGGGNPFLKPLKSTNFDASLEYYFSNTGFAAITGFHRDMTGFVLNRTFTYPDPDPVTGYPLEITGPVNTNKAMIDGVEAQVRTFFDFAGAPSWLHSFGIEANATYIDARADYTLFCAASAATCAAPTGGPSATVQRLPIVDVSKWAANITGMYENGPLSLRLAYNWRGPYPEGGLAEFQPPSDPCCFTLQGHGRPAPRLDFSSSYSFNPNLTIFFDWTNILKKPFKSDLIRVNYAGGAPTSVDEFPMVVRYEESILSAGIRFRFGREPAPALAPAPPMVMPPPPPPPPEVEAPPPPPPPPPPPAPVERGERGQ
jgi:TonB-dependent receptor